MTGYANQNIATDRFDRIVVGAGIAGLLAAIRANGRGESVLICEQNSQPGGALAWLDLAGLQLDAGAESFSIVTDDFTRLVSELGCESDVVEPARSDARIVGQNGLRYRIPVGYMGIPASLDDPELGGVLSADALAEARRRDSAPVPSFAGATVAEVVRERLGDAVVAAFVEPVIAGVHASSAANLDAHATLPAVMKRLPEIGSLTGAVAAVRGNTPRPGAAVKSVRGGVAQVIDRLVEELQAVHVEILLNSEVVRLERQADSWQVTVQHDDGSLRTFQTETVTLSGGPTTALRLLSSAVTDTAPELNLMSLSDSAPEAAVSLVVMRVESKQLDEHPLGSGALVRPDADIAAKATTHVNAKWRWVDDLLDEHHHIVRLSYGRDGVLPNEDVLSLAVPDLLSLYGITDARIVDSRQLMWPTTLSHSTPELLDLRARLSELADDLQVELCGAFVSGNGLLHIAHDHYQRIDG